RADHVAGELPAALLGQLEADRLGAFAVVRAQVHVDEPPAEAVRDLRAEPVHAVVVAAHADERGPVDGGGRQLGRLEVDGDENDRTQARRGRTGGDGVGEVAGGGAAHGVE